MRMLEIAAETARLLADINPAHEPKLKELAAEYFRLLQVSL